jgi:hypothetical protein
VRLAYADPPYLGCCGLYGHHHEAPFGCWDHTENHYRLVSMLAEEYDGYVLHLSTPSLPDYCAAMRDYEQDQNWRTMSWVKPFAAFKANVPVAYAWEPVIVKPARKPEVTGRAIMRDWIDAPITMERGTVGAKPERVCMWAFEMMGAHPDDELVDLFPGSGAVTRAWEKWRHRLPLDAPPEQMSLEAS